VQNPKGYLKPERVVLRNLVYPKHKGCHLLYTPYAGSIYDGINNGA
jgi:hypothetical protein